MASQQQLKSRIGSVKNTRQITKAMELVSASKMRKAQDNALKGRDYASLSKQLLTRLRELTDVSKHPLFELRKQPKARLHLVITSDRGLAGAYNSSVLKAFTKEVQADRDAGVASYVVTIGRQGSNFASKLEYIQVIGSYTEFPEQPTANDLRPILNTVVDSFLKGGKTEVSSDADDDFDLDDEVAVDSPNDLDLPAVDYVDIIYTDYKSSILQEVAITRLLPAAFTDVEIEPELDRAEFEPTPKAVLESVVQRLVEAELYQTILESLASEQSARMMAMKSASDNASDIIDDLTLAFNTARQAAITQELAEITGGAEAIK